MAGSIAAGLEELLRRYSCRHDSRPGANLRDFCILAFRSAAVTMRTLWLIIVFPAIAMAQTTTNASSQATSHFAQLADEFMKANLALSPTAASQAGYHKHVEGGRTRELDSELDDMGPQTIAKQVTFYTQWRDRF